MGKWAVPSLGIFSPRSRGPFYAVIFHPNADTSVVLGCKVRTDFSGGRGEKNKKLGSRGPIFANFCQFLAVWALLLKIQSAITPSILEVRDSSRPFLDSLAQTTRGKVLVFCKT